MKKILTMAATAVTLTATCLAQESYTLEKRQIGAKLKGWVIEKNDGPKINEDEPSLLTFTDEGTAFSTVNAIKKDSTLTWSDKHLMLRWVGYLDVGETGGEYTFLAQSINQYNSHKFSGHSLSINGEKLFECNPSDKSEETRKSKTITLNPGLNKVEIWMRATSGNGWKTVQISYELKDSENPKPLSPSVLVCEAPQFPKP